MIREKSIEICKIKKICDNMNMVNIDTHIPDDFRKIIESYNPDFPKIIFEILAPEDEEKIEEICE